MEEKIKILAECVDKLREAIDLLNSEACYNDVMRRSLSDTLDSISTDVKDLLVEVK